MTVPRRADDATTAVIDDPFDVPEIEHFAGVPIAAVTRDEIERQIAADVGRDRGGWLITANLDHLRRLRSDRSGRTREMLRAATVVVADGMPLVWAARLAGDPLPERVAGSDMIFGLTARVGEAGGRVFLLGGRPGAADEAAAVLRSATPGLVIDTACPPFGFEHDDAQRNAVHAAVVAARPDVVFVALGFPKQDELIARLRHDHPHAWYLGIGASVDFVAGRVARAPRWMQRTGIEWIHRLVQEPRRLVVRYLVHGLPFAAQLFAWALRRRLVADGPGRRSRAMGRS